MVLWLTHLGDKNLFAHKMSRNKALSTPLFYLPCRVVVPLEMKRFSQSLNLVFLFLCFFGAQNGRFFLKKNAR